MAGLGRSVRGRGGRGPEDGGVVVPRAREQVMLVGLGEARPAREALTPGRHGSLPHVGARRSPAALLL